MTPEESIFDALVAQFAAQAPVHFAEIQPLALGLAAALFTLQFGWDLGRWALTDDQQIFGKALNRLTVFLVLFGLIEIAPLWLPTIPEGFAALGERLTGVGLSPAAVLSQGINLAMRYFLTWDSLLTLFIGPFMLLRLITSAVVLLAFALVAYQLARVLIEVALALGALAIFLAASAHSMTFGLFEGYLRYLLELGVKIYVLFVIVRVGQDLGVTMEDALVSIDFFDNIRRHVIILLASLFFSLIAWLLPGHIAARIAGGFSTSGINPMGRG